MSGMTRDRAIEILREDANYASLWEIAEAVDMAIEALKEQRPHGEWIFDSNFTEFGNPYGTYKCSACGGHNSNKYSFCKDCGADMRPKEESEE